MTPVLVCPWQTLQEQIKEKVPFQIQKQEAIQKSEEKEISFQREEQEVSEHIQNQVLAPGNAVLSRTGIVPCAGAAGPLQGCVQLWASVQGGHGGAGAYPGKGMELLGGSALGATPVLPSSTFLSLDSRLGSAVGWFENNLISLLLKGIKRRKRKKRNVLKLPPKATAQPEDPEAQAGTEMGFSLVSVLSRILIYFNVK